MDTPHRTIDHNNRPEIYIYAHHESTTKALSHLRFGYVRVADAAPPGHAGGMGSPAGRPDVFGYLDYRAWLRDTYAARKAERRGFSYRAFSRKAGLASPNHLKRVIDGERGLTPAMAVRYASALQLDPEQTAGFLDLVAFGEAETDAERNAALERLRSSRGYRRAHRLEIAQAAYHSTWYLPAIREMVAVRGFRPDPAWIAKHLLPPITVAEATRALDTLVEIGLLRRRDDGGLEPVDAVVTTGPEVRGLHFRNYHRALLERAAEAMELVPATERDLSAVTFTVDDADLLEVKRRVQAFRKELVAWLGEVRGTRVVQLNLQLFPLSVPEE